MLDREAIFQRWSGTSRTVMTLVWTMNACAWPGCVRVEDPSVGGGGGEQRLHSPCVLDVPVFSCAHHNAKMAFGVLGVHSVVKAWNVLSVGLDPSVGKLNAQMRT